MYDTSINRTLIRLIESWATTVNPYNSTEEILAWVEEKNRKVKVAIRKRTYDYSGPDWHYDAVRGEIRNRTGTFFQIRGLRKIRDGEVLQEQPIIIQNEIGYLGIICKEFDGVLYFLMQAKIEPGNVNKIQISPTIQATKSNFMQVHGGRVPAYLEYFTNKKEYEIIADQIQSEQSSRFLGKRNRNIIILVEDEIEALDSHKWMTLGQIKQLMEYDNLVNMDTRTVISCIPFALRDFSSEELTYVRRLFSEESFFKSVFFGHPGRKINRLFQYMNEFKMLDKSEIQLVDLYALRNWCFDGNGEFGSPDGDFRIVYCDIEIEGREVQRWSQPLLEASGSSIFGLLYCEDGGIRKYLIQAKAEVGCFDGIEIGPSVQIGPHDKAANPVEKLFRERMAKNRGIEFSGLFSEEGGRFYQEQNRNVIMRIEKTDLPALLPEGFFWTDFQTLNILIQFNNCLNIQLRNLLSILKL